MLSDPRCGEALNFRDLFGQLATEVALDLATDHRDFELHNPIEAQLRAVPHRYE
jgi:hypothetical protein